MSRSHSFNLERLEKRMLFAATIHFSDVRQTIDGFGSESAFTANPTSTAIQQAYSQTNGIGLTFLRGSINQDGSTHQVDMMKQAAAYGVKLVMSARAAPSEWVANYNTTDGGYLLPSRYQDYASLLADAVRDWAAQGIPIHAMNFTVEPDLATTSPYTYMVWTQQQFADVLPVVASTFRSRGITTRIMLPESFRWDFSLANQVMADPSLAQYVDVLASHAYDQGGYPYAPVTHTQGRPVWMTEYIVNNSASSAIENAVATAQDIHEALTIGNAIAYMYFWMNDGGSSYLMTNWTPNKRFWAMGNYSKFVRPGWVRVDDTNNGALNLTAFKDPASGKFAIVAVNTGSTSITETYSLSGLSASSVTPHVTSVSDDLAQYPNLTVSGGTFTATIAANSIVTYYGISSATPALQAPSNLTVAPAYAFQTSRLSLNWSDNSSGELAYTVERSLDGTTWSILTSSLAANTTSYVDLTASESNTYYYRVRATSGASSSAYSAAVSGSTILAAPSNVSTTSISGGRRLSWTINSPVSTGVSIQRSLDGLTWSDIATLSTRATSYDDVIPGYNANRVYFYRVRNTLSANASAFAAYNTTIVTPPTFTAASVGPTSATLNWTNTAVGVFAATIEQNTAGWANIAPPNLGANAGSFVVNDLEENTAYTFRLAVVAGGAGNRFNEDYGAWSADKYVNLTTQIAAPTALVALSTGPSTAQLNWTDNSGVETAYTVERSTDGTTWTVLTSTWPAGATSYTDSASPTGTTYYRVKATVSAVSSAYVRTQRVTSAPIITTNATVAGTTTALSATPPAGFGSGTLTYTWSLDGTPPASVTFSSNGGSTSSNTTATFAAAGSYPFRVTIADSSGNTTSASSAVTVNQTLSSIAVTDYNSRAANGGNAALTPAIVKSTFQRLAAIAYDQFAIAMASQPAFTWSVLSGGGTVSSTGLYSAPASAGSPVVRAASGSVSGTITLNVLDTAQLKFSYSFNESSGFTAQDALGVGVTAKTSGQASFVPGRLGNAINFSGVDGSVWVGRPDVLDIRNQVTMAAWIKPASSSGTQIIISRGFGRFPNRSGTFLRISGGQYQVGYYDSGAVYRYASSALPAGDIGNWVHLVGTFDGQTWRLYRNGTQIASYVNSGGTTDGATYVPAAWRIGSSDASSVREQGPVPNDYFNGVIDSARLYAQALSASEINALYNQAIVITAAAAASPPAVNGASTSLSVAAVDPDSNADSLFTYTWSMVSGPAPVSFSANGSNAAKTTTANFTQSGTYTLRATIADAAGLSTVSTVNVTVDTSPYVLNNRLYVNFAGSPISLGTSSGNVTVTTGPNNYSFNPATFADILVTGTSGHDALTIASTLPKPMSFVGGAGSDSLIIASGASHTFATDSSQDSDSLTVTVNGSATFASSQTFAALTVSGTATLASGGAMVLTTSALSVVGTLDLTDNRLIVHNGDVGSFSNGAYTGITGLVAAGRNNGAWNGNGIITSAPAAQGSVSVMTLGVTTSGVDISISYVVAGDANADGTVNGDDFFRIDGGFGASLDGYTNGDFNYSGNIDADDYFIIDVNYSKSVSASAPLSSKFEAAQAAASAVSIAWPISPAVNFPIGKTRKDDDLMVDLQAMLPI